MRFTTPLFIALSAALVATACGGKSGGDSQGSCESLGGHFSKLARAEAEALPDDHPEKKAAMADLALLPKAAASLVKECRDEKWSTELRGCFLAAKDAAEFTAKCKQLIDRQATSGKDKSEATAGTPGSKETDKPAAKPATDQPASSDKPAGK